MMRMGLVSDTHGYFDPLLAEIFSGAAAILHAGDAGSQHVLDQLARIAPTHAVKGNVDSHLPRLPLSLRFEAVGLQIEMLHILPIPQTQLQVWAEGRTGSKVEPVQEGRFLSQFSSSTRIVIFGHTHTPGLYLLRERLFINPGSAGKKRFALPRCCAVMEVLPEKVEVKVWSLEDYNECMRKSVRIKGPLS